MYPIKNSPSHSLLNIAYSADLERSRLVSEFIILSILYMIRLLIAISYLNVERAQK